MLLSGGGRTGSSCNTMWPGPRSTSVPSGTLIHPTVWRQYTNVTDRQNRQRSDSIGRTILQTAAQKRRELSLLVVMGNREKLKQVLFYNRPYIQTHHTANPSHCPWLISRRKIRHQGCSDHLRGLSDRLFYPPSPAL